MKFTKTLASVAAAALAVSSLAVSAFADGLMSKTGNSSNAEKYVIPFTGLTEEQVATVKTIEADVDLVDTDYVNGTIGGNVDGGWSTNGQFELNEDGTIAWELPGSLVSYDADGNFAPYAEVQFWWVNNVPDTEDEGTAALTAVRLLDADGNEVKAEEDKGELVEIAYTDGKTPSYSYTVTGNSEALKVAVEVAPALDDGSFAWNDWCGEGVSVTYPDGTIKYYQFGGAQVTWEWGTEDEDGNKTVYSADGVNGETWVGTVSAEGGELTIPVVEGAVVDFYCLSWDSYAGTQLLFTDITEVPAEVAPGETTEPEDPQPEDPQPEDPQPVEPGETEDPSEILPGESSGTPVSPDTGVAVTVIPAALAAAALATTGIVLKKRSK